MSTIRLLKREGLQPCVLSLFDKKGFSAKIGVRFLQVIGQES
jgi:hypothetical protein